MGWLIEELEVERGRHWATLERLALINDESASVRVDVELAKAEVELAREALRTSRTLKSSKKKSSKMGLFLITSDMKTVEIRSESYIRIWI